MQWSTIIRLRLNLTLSDDQSVARALFSWAINGTSGYEEAGAQGLMAGLNATRFVSNQEPAVLERHEGYIGV